MLANAAEHSHIQWPHLIVVMGVSGSGKTTIGRKLAAALVLPFFDADDFHPTANIQKMQAGYALDDSDRSSWLKHLGEKLQQWDGERGAVLACSALKNAYREILSGHGQLSVRWVHLSGSREVIGERVRAREGHFMPESLLESQFVALEAPQGAICVDVGSDAESVVEKVLAKLSENNWSGEREAV